jgi:5-formyltetrahydrofolate cyclo-ligase
MSQKSDKQLVRAATLAARRAMTPLARLVADQALVAAAVRLVAGSAAIAAYAPMPAEPGGPALVDALAAAVDTLLLPVLRPDRDLDWTRYAGRSPEAPAAARLGVEAIAGVDIVLVPALGVDRSGVRLGRGGGSYDRALARVGAGTQVVALLYPGELCDELVREAHDRPVTAVLLPDGLHAL